MRILGILLVVAALPVFVILLKSRPSWRRYAPFTIALLPFVIDYLNLDAALVDWNMWPGHTKGMIVTLLDSLALAVLIAFRTKFPSPILIAPVVLYVAAAFISIAFSAVPMGTTFYAFQLVRILIVFAALAVLMQERTYRDWLCYGLASVAIVQAAFSLSQKASGIVQATGTLGHQNQLGMMLHFAVIPLIAVILSGDTRKLHVLGAIAGLLAAVLTASRASIAFLFVGIGLLVVFSLVRKATPIKWRALGLGLLAMAAIVPLAFASLGNRTVEDRASGDAERAAFERAAVQMWSDNPMGVGANRYVVVANTEGYSDEAGVIAVFGSRAAHVHNIYLLHAAEMGWLGLLSFVVLLGVFIVAGISRAIRIKNDPGGDLALGMSVAILTMALHGYFEWIVILSQPQYLLAIAMGVIAASMRPVPADRDVKRARANRRHPIVNEVMA